MIISTHPNVKWATYPLFILTSKKPVYKYPDYTLPSQALSITPNTNYTNHYFLASLWATWSILYCSKRSRSPSRPWKQGSGDSRAGNSKHSGQGELGLEEDNKVTDG